MAQLLDPDALPAWTDLPDTGEKHGPAVLDRDTVKLLAAQITDGRLSYPSNIDALISAADQTAFDANFRANLDKVQLNSRFATEIDNRALALAMTLNELVAQSAVADIVDGARIDPVALESYLAMTSDGLPARFTPEQRELLRDPLFTLTPAEVYRATGVTVNQLSQWRFNNVGPRFVKFTGGRDSIRYPAVALLRWAEEAMS